MVCVWLLVTVCIIVVFCLTTLVKYLLNLETVMCESPEKMHGKVVIVTGASSGMGIEVTRELAKRGAKIIMACRDIPKAEAVKNDIVETSGNENIIVSKLDLTSFDSINKFANDFLENEERLDVLIHNAATAESKLTRTKDGLETTMATNHFGPFVLTHRLIKILKRSAPSRVIVVASELYRLASIDPNNLAFERSFFPPYIYYVSKYANILFTLELAKQLEGTGVTANCLHPGMVDTGIWRNVPFPLNWPLKLIIKAFFKTSLQGAQTTIYLAVSDEVKNISGKYFMDCKEHSLSSGALDPDKAKLLWHNSLLSVNLRLHDMKI